MRNNSTVCQKRLECGGKRLDLCEKLLDVDETQPDFCGKRYDCCGKRHEFGDKRLEMAGCLRETTHWMSVELSECKNNTKSMQSQHKSRAKAGSYRHESIRISMGDVYAYVRAPVVVAAPTLA